MNATCTLTNLNTRIRSSTLYANARTPLDSIWSNFRRPPEKSHLQPQVSEKLQESGVQKFRSSGVRGMGGGRRTRFLPARLGLKCAAPPFRPPDIHGRPIPYRKIVPERSIPALRNRRANGREQTTRLQRPRRTPSKAESPKAGDRPLFRHKSSSRNFFG